MAKRSETSPPSYYSLRERGPTNSGRTITSDESHRSALKRIAEETLAAIRDGRYPYKGLDKDLKEAAKGAKSKTVYYSPDSSITKWASSTKPNPTHPSPTHISILHVTTLDAARILDNVYKSNPSENGKTGILKLRISNETRWRFPERRRRARGIHCTIIDAVYRSRHGESTAVLQTTQTRKCRKCSCLLFP